MTTFAHIETGQALDPWPNGIQADYLARFPGVDKSGWNTAQVIDGTQQGATVGANVGGIYQTTNPPGPTIPPVINTTLGASEYKAAIFRQAAALAKKGQNDKALLLLKQKGF